MGWIRAAATRVVHFGVLGCVAFALFVGYGIDSEDARVLNEFCAGVERWQTGPDFRRVADEYVRLSHAAMNATPWGVRVTTLIMSIRSVPGLGPQYAVSPTSQSHYDDFTRGELSAYLHLCGEQTMDWVIREFHEIALRGSSDADVERFLKSWKMNRPVACDPVAVAGVKRLLVEIDAIKPMHPQTHVGAELNSAAAEIAWRMHYPSEHERQTRAQQRDVYQQLDESVRDQDPKLWRYKQVSDLCSGIWAQTFGRDYTMVIVPALAGRQVGRIVGLPSALCLVLLRRERRRDLLRERRY